MTTTVSLPFLDNDGTLTPLVIEAMSAGATSERDGDDKITLTFRSAKAATAFKSAAKIVDDQPVEPAVEEVVAPE